MKSSSLFYTGAVIAFILTLAWSSVIFLGYHYYINSLSKYTPFPPAFLGFVIIFTGIFLCKKGNEATNLEHGRPANATIPPTRIHNIINITGITLCAVLAIVAIIKFINQ